MSKAKIKTHKATKKRFVVSGSGQITRQKRRNRNQRFARNTNRKDSNTDSKALKLSPVEERKVKKLLSI